MDLHFSDDRIKLFIQWTYLYIYMVMEDGHGIGAHPDILGHVHDTMGIAAITEGD